MDRPATVIVGGGIAGLACARRLHEAGHPFLLVTDRLGGRLYHRPDGSINFGATYVNEDYRHLRRFVRRGIPFRLREAYCENGGRLSTLFHPSNLRHARSVARLVLRLRELRSTLRDFRRASERVAQRDLLPHYPLIARYARQPAPELVAELGLGRLHERYFKLAFQATCFVDPARVNALFYLGTLFPVIVRTWVADFTGAYARLTAGFEGRIVLDTVTALERRGDGWSLRTAAGREDAAAQVVLAAPYHNASALYPVPRPYLPTSGTMLAVRGERRPLYAGKRFVLRHPEADGVALLWRQACGEDLVFCTRPRPELAGVFAAADVTGRVTWKTAVVVSDANWAPARLGPGLLLAGDYNLCGMEDAYLSGLCAANQILKGAANG